MSNHRWDNPKSKVSAKCLICGLFRFSVNPMFGKWEYVFPSGHTTLDRPNCKKITFITPLYKPPPTRFNQV